MEELQQDRPVCIYELYPDKWIREDRNTANLTDFADGLSNYVRQLGCTHVLLSGDHPNRDQLAEKMEALGIGTVSCMTQERSFGDVLINYISVDPYFRKGVHESLVNAVNGCTADTLISLTAPEFKKTPVDAAFGSYDEKFAGVRLMYTLMMAVPGKKHIFMGGELAPFKAWDGTETPEWFLLDFERHRQTRIFTAALGQLYLSEPALGGEFEWLLSDADINVIAFRRRSLSGDIIAAFNFSPVARYNLEIDSDEGVYREVFSTDVRRFGGNGHESADVLKSAGGRLHFDIPGLTALLFRSEIKFSKK